ncbi:hypothetical protein GCM10023350_22720 [Nocardioides endophyticus]|uniref:Uncharacterized protein n=1 Tax=Nocardioides endophyticus TaxID=1353775 RepID=A0ABP8YTU7_9ACTN
MTADERGGTSLHARRIMVGAGTRIVAPFGMGDTSPATWDHVWAVNARSHALLATQALTTLADGGAMVVDGGMTTLALIR